jgi:hypothetical protein
MIIAYSKAQVIEEILIARLSEYFKTVGWDEQFPNHPLRINNEFPWVPYMTSEEYYSKGWVDLSNVQDTLFPSVTIATTEDLKSPDDVLMEINSTSLLSSEFDEFKAQAQEDGYMVSPDALLAMSTFFAENDTLYGVMINYRRRDTVSFDVHVDDHTNVKNRVYDYLSLFLATHGAVELREDLGIQIVANSITGSRSGTYNLDFGRVIRGASIQFEVDYNISQVYYDTSVGVLESVQSEHTTEAG